MLFNILSVFFIFWLLVKLHFSCFPVLFTPKKKKKCVRNLDDYCKNGKYLASIIDKVIYDKIIDVKETNSNEKNITCEFLYFTYLFINHHHIIDSC